MLRRIWLSCLLTVGLAAAPLCAAEVSLTLRPDRVVYPIDEKVYGHFLEHIYHSCNGGLWGELVWDRSFEGGGAGVAWTRQDSCIAQEGAAADVRLLFGDPQWTDYEFTVEARKTGGVEGFLILVRALNGKEFCAERGSIRTDAFPWPPVGLDALALGKGPGNDGQRQTGPIRTWAGPPPA